MYAYIILESIPPYQARIDLISTPIQDNFKGFREVPYGLHYINVKTQNNYPGFWCYVKSDQVVVKILMKRTQEFEDFDPVTIARYQRLLSHGLLEKKNDTL